jgi:HEPN domain-containing protein
MNHFENISHTHVDFYSGNLGPTNPLDAIVHVVSTSIHTDNIYLLGIYPAFPHSFGIEYDLLVMVDSCYKKPMHELESLIANRCHDLAMVTASVHKTDVIKQLLIQGNIFFSALCKEEKLVFDGIDKLSTIESADVADLRIEELEKEFHNQYSRAKSFLSGAISYRITEDNQLAAFMLHQTVEQTLNAFLTPLIGYRLQTHNLSKLFMYSRRLSQKFYTVFPRNTDVEIQLYQILQKAYIYGRYKNNFQIGKETLQILVERVTVLLEMTRIIFYEKIEILRNGVNGFI